jgi:hypothetical protein
MVGFVLDPDQFPPRAPLYVVSIYGGAIYLIREAGRICQVEPAGQILLAKVIALEAPLSPAKIDVDV